MSRGPRRRSTALGQSAREVVVDERRNKARLVRQAKAVCRALGLSDGVTVKLGEGNDGPFAALVMWLPVFGVPGQTSLECRFARSARYEDAAIDACREALVTYLARHGLMAGADAMRAVQ